MIRRNWLVIFIILVLTTRCRFKDNEQVAFIPVSLNHKPAIEDHTGSYSLFAMGHIYGKPGGDSEEHISRTLLSSIPMLVDLDPDAIVLMGDSIKTTEPEYLQYLDNSFISQFDIPILNAFGNHDKSVESLEYFGIEDTYYSLIYQNTQLIILDTNIDLCNIQGDQSIFLSETIEQALGNNSIDNILIFMHHAIFINDSDLYEEEFFMTNPNRWECYGNTNYPDIFNSYIYPAGLEKPVYLFAGDVGAFSGNLSPYFYTYPDTQVTEIATGLGDHENDSIILIEFNDMDGLTIKAIALAGLEMMPIESYTKDYYLQLAIENT